MDIYQALKAIDNRVTFDKGRAVLDLHFFDDDDHEHRITVFIPKTLMSRLKGSQSKLYKAMAKQYGDMYIISIKKEMYNESYTVINNKVVDHEKYNPNQFISFTHYTRVKQDYFRKI